MLQTLSDNEKYIDTLLEKNLYDSTNGLCHFKNN